MFLNKSGLLFRGVEHPYPPYISVGAQLLWETIFLHVSINAGPIWKLVPIWKLPGWEHFQASASRSLGGPGFHNQDLIHALKGASQQRDVILLCLYELMPTELQSHSAKGLSLPPHVKQLGGFSVFWCAPNPTDVEEERENFPQSWNLWWRSLQTLGFNAYIDSDFFVTYSYSSYTLILLLLMSTVPVVVIQT